MPVTINVNGLSLCHKGSGGVSMATIPDVCKTPSPGGPVPVPYPNVAKAGDLAKGTTTVSADGGNMCAKYGSEFSLSVGDEPGTAGGVKSSTFKKEASWITHSFDVKLEGKGACRLSDKMFHNHQNAANMGGLLQAPLEAWPELIELCVIICRCDKAPTPSASGASDLKEQCVENALRAQDATQRAFGAGPSNMRPEVPYNMTTSPPSPLLHRVPNGTSLDHTAHLPTRMAQDGLRPARQNFGVYDVRVPDVVISRAVDGSPAGAMGSLTAPNLKAVVEIKFNRQARDPSQIADYERIAGGDPNRVVELDPQECRCNEAEPRAALEREQARARQRATQPAPAAQPAPAPQPVPASSGVFDLKTCEAITGLSGAALILYLVVSEGSRLFPPRNLVPIP